MNLEFDSKDLEIIIYTPFDELPKKIKRVFSNKEKRKLLDKYIRFCNFVIEAESLEEIRQIPGYNLEQLKGTDKYSVRLNKQYRIIFTFDIDTNTIKIFEISKHYEN